VRIDGDEAVTIGWKPDDPGAFEFGERHNPVGVELSRRVQRDRLLADGRDGVAGDHLDPTVGQERGNRLAGSIAEHRQRRRLRRDQHQSYIGKTLVP
jgi:hypothetical protein